MRLSKADVVTDLAGGPLRAISQRGLLILTIGAADKLR